MADITISSRVRTNLLALQQTSDLMTTTQGRLATGKKVNSALDNPTSYFVAQGLNDRATQLNTLLDGMNNAISTIQAASKALDSIYKALQSAQGLIDKMKADATGSKNQVTGAGTTLTSATTLASLGFSNNDNLTLTNATTGATFTVNVGTVAGKTVSDLIAQINTASGGVYSASVQGGLFVLNASNAVSGAVTLSNTTAGALTGLLGTGSATSTVVSGLTQPELDSYAKQYNDILTSIDQLAQDAGFNGVNLLQAGNDLVVNFNEDGTSSQTVKSRTVSAASFTGVQQVSTTASTLSDYTGQVAALKGALGTVRSNQTELASSLSIVQNRQDFSKSIVNTLKTGADNLVNADANEEAANLLALQTRQQLSQTALSLANQADQAVLRLFQ
jgi:flagellin-like hook-associated protein FlgL